MRYILLVFVFLFTGSNVFSQEQDSLSLLLNVIDNPDITKVTYYPLDEISQSSIRTDVDIRRIVKENLVKYDLYLSNYSNYKDRATSIGYLTILKLDIAISDLKEDLQQNIENENKKGSSFYYLENGFKIGYYFKKGEPQWYFQIDSFSSRSELATIYWFEETIKEALKKIDSLIIQDEK
jgi:hypothetical protein